jgi:hypothetical protein
MMREAFDQIEEGVKVVDNLDIISDDNDMKINIKKTKVMRISKDGEKVIKIILDGHQLEQERSFKYLGGLITDNGK